MDSAYLKQRLGKCLVEAVAEVVERRPMDPIEFLAHYINKYKENMEYERKKAAHQKQMQEELQKAYEEEEHRKRLKEEEERIQATQEEPVSTSPSPLEERPIMVDPPKMEVLVEADGSSGGTEAPGGEGTDSVDGLSKNPETSTMENETQPSQTQAEEEVKDEEKSVEDETEP